LSVTTTRAWLFVRGPESVRIVSDEASIAIYGPGRRFSHSRFGNDVEAALHQAAVEQALVHSGWSLERLTTERRSPHRQRILPREAERRSSSLRLVGDAGDPPVSQD
jgi:hypothetical protein